MYITAEEIALRIYRKRQHWRGNPRWNLTSENENGFAILTIDFGDGHISMAMYVRAIDREELEKIITEAIANIGVFINQRYQRIQEERPKWR